MKIKLMIFIAVLLPAVLFSQIPNNSFENWITNSSSDPDVWMSSNTFWFGSNTVMQDTDSYSGQYAALVQTTFFGQDTAKGMLLIGSPGNQAINGGLPYSGHPDSMICAVRYNVQPADTAVIYIFFKKNGAMIGIFPLRFTGVQTTWLQVKAPVSWMVPDSVDADTVAALISSSNMDYPAIPGSYLAVDGIAYNNDTTPFPNGDFESWITASWDDLADGWNSLNPLSIPFSQLSATKDTVPYTGSYAVRVQSLAFPNFGNQVMGFVFLGQWTSDGPGGGIPFTQKPSKLTGYYKYFPMTGDSASVIVKFDNDSNLEFTTYLTAASTYTYFEVPINLVNDPDTVLIGITANNMDGSPTPGSMVVVDDLNFVIIVGSKEVKVPLHPGFNVQLNDDGSAAALNYFLSGISDASFYISDVSGKILLKKSMGVQNGGFHNQVIDVSYLSPGLYLFNFNNGEKLFTEKIIVK